MWYMEETTDSGWHALRNMPEVSQSLKPDTLTKAKRKASSSRTYDDSVICIGHEISDDLHIVNPVAFRNGKSKWHNIVYIGDDVFVDGKKQER